MPSKKRRSALRPQDISCTRDEISRVGVQRAKKLLKSKKLDALLITSHEAVRYFSGFTGTDATLVIHSGKPRLLTDSRYTEQAKAQCPLYKVITYRKKFDAICESVKSLKAARVGIEARHMDIYTRKMIIKGLKGAARLVPQVKAIDDLRMVKLKPEVDFLKQAAVLAESGFYKALEMIKPGVREKDVALEMEFFARKAGAGNIPFDFIVASGLRGAMPHGVASDKKIRGSEMITIDFGATFNGYASDETATVALGRPKAELVRIYEIVREAQSMAIDKARPGISLKKLDAVARDHIERAGYGKYFGHGLGHGVGLAVHEEPNLSPLSKGKLEVGMIVTVEPGIYVPGLGGVRLEDMVHITDNGAKLITNVNKELLVL